MDTLFLALRVLLSLAAVLGLLWFLHRRLNRTGRGQRAAKPISVVARQGIGQKASIVIADVEGRRYTLGVTEHSIQVLEAPKTEPGATAQAPAEASFDERLAEAEPAEPVELLRPRRRRATAMEGSILAPSTWRQTAAAFRQLK